MMTFGHQRWAVWGVGLLMGTSALAADVTLKLGHLNVLWDDNKITIDGSTDLSTSEDIAARYAATGWHVESCDGHDPADIRRAIDAALIASAESAWPGVRQVAGLTLLVDPASRLPHLNTVRVPDGVDEAAFVAMRTQRDAGLGMPTLLLPAIQVNVRAGHLPPAEENGVTYLKIPLNKL